MNAHYMTKIQGSRIRNVRSMFKVWQLSSVRSDRDIEKARKILERIRPGRKKKQ